MVKGKQYTDSLLTALLVLLSQGAGRSPGTKALCSLRARLSLPNVPKGHKNVGCQKSSWDIASPLPEGTPHICKDRFK